MKTFTIAFLLSLFILIPSLSETISAQENYKIITARDIPNNRGDVKKRVLRVGLSSREMKQFTITDPNQTTYTFTLTEEEARQSMGELIIQCDMYKDSSGYPYYYESWCTYCKFRFDITSGPQYLYSEGGWDPRKLF